MFGASEGKLRSFACDAKGNVALLFAFSLIPLLLGVGVAVDYGRALIVRERMADAADAAGLAIGSWPGLTEAELTTKAQQFFDANYPPDAIGTVGKLNVNFVGDEAIIVTVSGVVPTTFMQLANIGTVDVGASTTINKKERNIELVLVLDTTGSMASSGKMAAMQSAAKKMVQDLFQNKSTSDTLKIGVVPFSGAVNIGTDNSGWLDKATYPNMSAIAKEDFNYANGESALKFYDPPKITNRTWPGCVRERGGSFELTDDPPGSSAASNWAPYFAPDEPDTGNYCNNYADDKTTGSGDKRQRYTPKYNNLTVQGGTACASMPKGPDFNCPPRAITPMTNIQGQVVSAIEELQPKGYTVIPAGLLWGWRAISPTVPFTEGAAYNDEKWVKAIVLLTDGQNEVNGGSNGHNESVYNAFGYAACCGSSGHLGSANGSQAESTLNSKTATVCSAIKAKGILLYTIGFQLSSSTTQNLLKNCATKPDMYYNSPSNEQLAGVFQDIAQGLSELRIAQ